MENIIIYMIAAVLLILWASNRAQISEIKKAFRSLKRDVGDLEGEVFDNINSSWAFFDAKVSVISELRKFNRGLISYLGVDVFPKDSEKASLVVVKKKKGKK